MGACEEGSDLDARTGGSNSDEEIGEGEEDSGGGI
jgi:hypothetical protein